MATILGIVLIAFAPMLIYAFFFWSLDHHEREPWWLVSGMFLWGAIPAVALSLFGETCGLESIVLQSLGSDATADQVLSVCVAPVCEEFAKGAALIAILLFAHRQIDGVVDGLLYGALVGFGFSATEDSLYYWSTLRHEGVDAMWREWLVRSYATGLAHTIFSCCVGVAIALARDSRTQLRRVGLVLGGFAAAIVLHAGFNHPDVPITLILVGGFLFLSALAYRGLARERHMIWTELYAEVERGTLTSHEASMMGSTGRRSAHLLRVLGTRGWGAWSRLARFFRTSVELAFLKRHRRFRDDSRLTPEIHALRASIAEQRFAIAPLIRRRRPREERSGVP